MIEIWKDIKECAGKYQVSNIGRVKSLNRGNPIIMRPVVSRKGYARLCFGADYKTKNVMIHRLVALYFCGGYSPNKEINHKDCDKLNNNFNNLEWVSRRENTNYSKKMGLYLKGDKHPRSKLTEQQVLRLRKLRKEMHTSFKELANYFGISVYTAAEICQRRTWRHI